jgi:ABC-type transporter Mla subunit MlaD
MFGWIVQQILGNIPTSIWPLVAGVGLGVFFLFHFLSALPQVKPYSIIIRPIALLIVAGGVFMWGGAGVSEIYQAQLKDQEKKDAVAEVKSETSNVQIKTVYVDRVKYIHIQDQQIHSKIILDADKMNKGCKLDPSVILDLNAAALMGDTK